MSILILILVIVVALVIKTSVNQSHQIPPIRDYERFNKESIQMSKEELKKAMKSGRWS